MLDNHSVVITRFRDSTTFIPNGSFKALMRRFNTWFGHMTGNIWNIYYMIQKPSIIPQKISCTSTVMCMIVQSDSRSSTFIWMINQSDSGSYSLMLLIVDLDVNDRLVLLKIVHFDVNDHQIWLRIVHIEVNYRPLWFKWSFALMWKIV